MNVMNPLAFIALAIGFGSIYLAYTASDFAIGVLGGGFFLALGFCSILNKGRIEGPFVYVAASAVLGIYAITGLVTGRLRWRSHVALMDRDSYDFWITMIVLLTFSVAAGITAAVKYRSERQARLKTAATASTSPDSAYKS